MTNTNENIITHLFLGFNNEEQPTLLSFKENKNIEIVGDPGSGKTNLLSSILLQSINNSPKSLYIISEKSNDYTPFIEKGAHHTSNVDEFIEYVAASYDSATEDFKDSILVIENLDKVIKESNAAILPHLLQVLAENSVTVITIGESKSLLSGLFNVKLYQVEGKRHGNFNFGLTNSDVVFPKSKIKYITEFTAIKSTFVDLFKEEIKALV